MATHGLVAVAWGTSGVQTEDGVWGIVAVAGPALFPALALFLIVRAILRQRRYRVVRAFGDADREAVRAAVTEAERKTVGEILPVVVERSDPHPGADWLTALLFALVGSSLLITWLPWDQPIWLLLVQLGLGAIGFVLARALPDLKRSFVFEDRATAVAEEQAFQEFYANGLHRTENETGVLLFVSLFERRVVVLADEGIDGKVEPGFWEGIDVAVLDEVRDGSLRNGLVEAVRRVGERLSESFPWVEGDRNEIPDRVIVRRE